MDDTKRNKTPLDKVSWGEIPAAPPDSPIYKSGWIIGGHVGAKPRLPTGTVIDVAPAMTKQQMVDALPSHLRLLGFPMGAEKGLNLSAELDVLRMKIPAGERLGVLASTVTSETVAVVAYLLASSGTLFGLVIPGAA